MFRHTARKDKSAPNAHLPSPPQPVTASGRTYGLLVLGTCKDWLRAAPGPGTYLLVGLRGRQLDVDARCLPRPVGQLWRRHLMQITLRAGLLGAKGWSDKGVDAGSSCVTRVRPH